MHNRSRQRRQQLGLCRQVAPQEQLQTLACVRAASVFVRLNQ